MQWLKGMPRTEALVLFSPENLETGAVLGGSGPMRGGKFHEWIHNGQISEVCVSGGSWCDRGAVLEDTCPAKCETFSSGSVVLADVRRQLERKTSPRSPGTAVQC